MIPKRRKRQRSGIRKDDTAYWDRRQGQFVRGFRCAVENGDCIGDMQSHHETSRGAGGQPEDQVPLCLGHHDERHALGRESFKRKYGVDLRALAGALASEYRSPLRQRDRQRDAEK